VKIGKIIGIIVAVIVVIIGGGAAYLASMDADEFRPEIARAAQEATGRALQLEGPLSLSISLTPTISGEGISLANAPWGSRPQMLTLRRFEVELQLLPLLFGDIRINRLILIEPDILLETNAKGVGNWRFETMAAKADTAEDGGGDGAMPHIGRLLIENGQLTYRDGVSGETTKIMLTSLEADAASPSDPLNLKLRAAFNDIALTLQGSVGPLKNALSPDQALRIDLTAAGLGLTVKIKGSAKAASGVLDARIDVTAADLSGLRALAGDGVPANVALKLSTQVKAAAGKVSLSDLVLTLGKSDLAGSVAIDTAGKLPKITADLKGNRLDLSELLPPADKGSTEKTPKPRKSGRPGKVLPAEPLPLDGLKAAEAQVNIALGEVVMLQITLNEVSATIRLAKGRLTLEPLKATVAGGPVTITASIDAGGKVPTVALNVSAPKLDLGRLLREAKITDLLQGTGSLTIKLTGKGGSIAAIAGSLNGGTNFLLNQGKIKTEALDMAVGGLSAIVGMMSSEKSEWTVLNCIASRFDFKNGVATSRVLLADTEYSTVVGEGSMDLGQEALAMKISPQSKSATLNLAVPIKIGGTFAEPTFRPDELATARRLGGLLGATLFPPAALLALADLGSGEDNPCLKIAKGGGKTSSQRTAQPAAQPAVKAVTDAIKAPPG
jgi:uncharacterized protein involved in outer membrane biogenesis